MAHAYNLPYISITSPEMLLAAINETLNSDGPIICEIFASPHQEIIPSVSSQKLANGQMVSKPLDDMFPFMDEEKRQAYLLFDI